MGQLSNEEIEQLAKDHWSRRFIQYDVAKIAHKFGFSKDEIRHLEWEELPDVIKDYLRQIESRYGVKEQPNNYEPL